MQPEVETDPDSDEQCHAEGDLPCAVDLATRRRGRRGSTCGSAVTGGPASGCGPAVGRRPAIIRGTEVLESLSNGLGFGRFVLRGSPVAQRRDGRRWAGDGAELGTGVLARRFVASAANYVRGAGPR